MSGARSKGARSKWLTAGSTLVGVAIVVLGGLGAAGVLADSGWSSNHSSRIWAVAGFVVAIAIALLALERRFARPGVGRDVLAALGVALLVGAAAAVVAAVSYDDPEITGPRTVTVLGVNDIYRIDGVDNGRSGHLARLRVLRIEVERGADDVLLLHAGDVVSPSFLGRHYFGEQMVDVLNYVDGKGDFDERMFVAFGNHEFDGSTCADMQKLRDRVQESHFEWLSANVQWDSCDEAAPIGASGHVRPHRIVEAGGIRIGLLGLTVQPSGDDVEKLPTHDDPMAAARASVEALQSDGAEVIIALTHLDEADDREILDAVTGIDLIMGGHDHDRRDYTTDDGRAMYKADADAVSAVVIDLTIDEDGEVTIVGRYEDLEDPDPKDSEVEEIVDGWLERHAIEFCGAEGPECLEEELTRTDAEPALEGEELEMRRRETTLGNWLADRMIESADPCAPDIAFVNAGSFRLNYDIPPDTMLTRGTVEQIFGFPVVTKAVRLSGSDVMAIVEHSLERRRTGGWAHFSGLSFSHDGTTVVDDSIMVGGAALDLDGSYTVISTEFLVDERGDGYEIPPGAAAAVDPECHAVSVNLRDEVLRKLRAMAPDPITPKIEGRICDLEADQDCEQFAG